MLGFRKPRRRPIPPPWARDYDERVYHRGFAGPRNTTLGVAAALAVLLLSYLGVAKTVKLPPFAPAGVELTAVFEDASTLRRDSPVRVAGVDVGTVTSAAPHGDATEVTFVVTEESLPVHSDATILIRPRLFLEGNFFLDLQPGSPGAQELEGGDAIPATQTATAVQLDQVLTALQAPDRENLQQLLEGFGTALTHEPTAAEDRTQDPDVRGETAAAALNDSFAYGGPAGRDSALVNEALLGVAPHELSALIATQRRVFDTLADREAQLQDLIVNLNTTAGALAAESGNLAASVRELAPTLERATPALLALDRSFPPLRSVAAALEPSLRPLPRTIRLMTPWLGQARKLLGERELGGLAPLLLDAAPGLARTSGAGGPLFAQLNLASRCASDVLIPAGGIAIDDAGGSYPIVTGQPNYRELLYGAVGISGESQSFDGNGSFVRFQPGGGPTLVEMPNPGGGAQNTKLFAHTIEPPVGTRPILPAKLPPYRPDVACHANALPDLNGAPVGPPLPSEVTP